MYWDGIIANNHTMGGTAMASTHKKRLGIPILWDKQGRDIPTVVSIVNGIRKAATQAGLSICLFDSSDDLLAQSQPDDAIIAIGLETSSTPKALFALHRAGRRIVVTSMDTDHISSAYSCSTFSRRQSTEQMLDFLLDKGCQSIALVGCGEHSANDLVHMASLEQYCSGLTGMHSKCFLYKERIEESFASFYGEWRKYDAVMCPNAFASVAFLRFCEQNGLVVPYDFLLVSVKDSDINRFCKPTITSMSIDFFSIGEQAVMVWRYLQNEKSSRLRMRIASLGHIVERESTGTHLTESVNHRHVSHTLDNYSGGPFFSEPWLQNLMRLESCLQECNGMDVRIIGMLLDGYKYEQISELLFLGNSSLQYRIKRLFHLMNVSNRKELVALLQDNFTRNHYFNK